MSRTKEPFRADVNGDARAHAAKDLARTRPPMFRQVPPYCPFPVEALPEPIREYVQQGAAALGCDPAYIALPALAVVASAIGNSRVIRLKGGWVEPAIIWSAIVGDSGTLKSPAYLKAVAYLFRVQKRFLLEYKEGCARHHDELQKHREAKAKAKNGDGEDPGPPPDPPVLRRVVCSDVTIQKLAEILEDNPRGILLARDELAGWLGSFKQYKGKSEGSDLPNWLEAHRAGTWIIDRKTGERRHYFVPHACISLTGSIQPGVLSRALTPEFLDAGGAARLLLAMPPKLTKHWTETEVGPVAEQDYQTVIDRLLELALTVNKDAERVPHVVNLSADGKATWVRFYERWAREQAQAEGEMAAALSKLEGYAARLALIHHAVERVARGEDDLRMVTAESVEAGIALADWFANEARRIYVTLTECQEEHDTRRLVEFIRSHDGQMTTKNLQRSNSRKYPSSTEAEAALQALADAGAGHWVDRPTGPKGGRPTRALVLHPTIDETDQTQDGNEPDADETADVTPSPSDETRAKHRENRVGSVSSIVGNKNGTVNDAEEVPSDGFRVSSEDDPGPDPFGDVP